jgi:hypothetical protein
MVNLNHYKRRLPDERSSRRLAAGYRVRQAHLILEASKSRNRYETPPPERAAPAAYGEHGAAASPASGGSSG